MKNTDYEGLAYLGEYPLAWSACCANESVYNLLLDNGADPDAQDSFGNMILHMVVVCDKLVSYSALPTNSLMMMMMKKKRLIVGHVRLCTAPSQTAGQEWHRQRARTDPTDAGLQIGPGRSVSRDVGVIGTRVLAIQ